MGLLGNDFGRSFVPITSSFLFHHRGFLNDRGEPKMEADHNKKNF